MSGKIVCVIGAGAAGLCAARHLLATPGLTPVVYEQGAAIGGTWVYTPETGTDSRHGLPIHASMYEKLRTNLPKECMAFPDFPFDPDKYASSFIGHAEVRRYLEEYCEHFGLKSRIHLEKQVKLVKPDGGGGWKVSVKDLCTSALSDHSFDAVVVCNGHYSIPAFADVAGMDAFAGVAMHSHDYRVADDFRGKRVVVLGASASGQDIGLEIATTADKVYVSHNGPKMVAPLPENVEQTTGVIKCTGPRDFEVVDGTGLKDIDAIIFCTGYAYDMSFVSDEVPIRLVDRQIQPLYKHLVHTAFPTMSVIGVPIKILPFPVFDVQIRYVCSYLTGKFKLPSTAEMDAYVVHDKAKRLRVEGIVEKYYHKFSSYQWEYLRDLADESGVEPLPPGFEQLYELVWGKRRLDLQHYKDDNYTWSEKENKFVERKD